MIVCRRCGQRNDASTEFCTSCSAYLEWDGQPAPPAPPAPPSPAPPAPPTGPPAPVEPAAPPGAPALPGKVRCLECGAANQGGNRFCRRCGATLDLVVLTGPRTLPAPVPPPPLPAPPPTPVGRAPAPAPPPAAQGAGLQPALVPAGPGPVRPEPEEAPVPVGGSTCPQCRAGNEAGRRFCRRCGLALDVPAPPSAVTEAPRVSWWRRLLRRGTAAPPSARAAYRRALGLRFRVLRVVAVVATLGMGAGLLGVSGIDPVDGARRLWKRVFPRDEPVTEVTAVADPVAAERREFAAAAAVDGAPDTAWAATWNRTPDDDPVPACAPDPGTGGADAALVLALPQATDLSHLEVQAGLPRGDADRENQWRPTLLELRYDDGSCQQVELSAKAGMQRHPIDAGATESVRITVLDAAPPPSGTGDLVAIGEIRLHRPQ